jgi:hypothetical protein
MVAAPEETKMPARPLAMSSLFDEIDPRRVDNKPYIAKGYKIRMEIFLDMIKQGSPFRDANDYEKTFTLSVSGSDAGLINKAVKEFKESYYDRSVPYEVRKEIKKNITKPLRDVTFTKSDGTKIKVTSIYKTKAFGGTEKLEAAGKQHEFKTIDQLNNIIQSSIKKYGSFYKDSPNYIRLRVDGRIYKVSKCFETPNIKGQTVKSDFHIVDNTGKNVIFISYKESAKPSDVQQWGGLTEGKMPDYAQSKDFIAKVKKLYPLGLPNATAVAMKIVGNKSTEIKNKSVFGIDWMPGAAPGYQNVNVVAKGRLRLNQVTPPKQGVPPLYEFTAAHFFFGGDTPSGETEPVFYARYDKRSAFGIGNVRMSVFPKGGIKGSTQWIDPASSPSSPKIIGQSKLQTYKQIEKRKGVK